MASQFSPEMMEHLTPLVREIIGLIGFDATVRLVERFGGARIPLSRGLREHGEKYINLLLEVISREEIDKLYQYFGDEVYVANCASALREVRNRQFLADYDRMRDEGCSERHTFLALCGPSGISCTTARKILLRRRVELQEKSVSQHSLF